MRVRLAALCLWVLTVDPIAAQTESASKVIEKIASTVRIAAAPPVTPTTTGTGASDRRPGFVVGILITAVYVRVG